MLKILNGYKFSISFILFPIILFFFSALVGELVIYEFVKYSLFYLLVLVPTSVFLCDILLKNDNINIFEKFVLGYPASIVYYSIVYYISRSISSQGLIYLFLILPYLYFIISKKKNNEKYPNMFEFVISVISIIFICALFFVFFTITTKTPSTKNDGVYYQDILWTIGNTWSIIRGGFPVVDFRFSGIPFSYHMIQNIFYAFSYQLTGVDPFYLHMRFGPLLEIFMLSSMVIVGTKVFLNWNFPKSVLFFFTLFLTCGFPNWLFNGYLTHIYLNPISLFFGLSSFVLFYFLILNHVINNKLYVVYTSIILLLAFSSKSSLIFTIIPALFFYLLLMIYNRKKVTSKEILFSVLVLNIVGLLYFTLYSNAGGNLSLKEYPKYQYFDLLKIVILRLVKPMCTLYTLVFFTIYLINKQFRIYLEKYRLFVLFILAHFVISILWIVFFNFFGGEVYFIWYSIITFCFLFTITINYLLFIQKLIIYKFISIAFLSVGFLLFISLSIKSTLNNNYWRFNVLNNKVWDKRVTISKHEYDAMQWIKLNLNNKSVLISDRRGFTHETNGQFVNRFFGYSAFSGKQFYNEGDEFTGHNSKIAFKRWENVIRLLNSNSISEASINWNKIPAEYVICSKRFESIQYGLLHYGKKVFENDEIVVVKKPD
jgi:hypothetical protein